MLDGLTPLDHGQFMDIFNFAAIVYGMADEGSNLEIEAAKIMALVEGIIGPVERIDTSMLLQKIIRKEDF